MHTRTETQSILQRRAQRCPAPLPTRSFIDPLAFLTLPSLTLALLPTLFPAAAATTLPLAVLTNSPVPVLIPP